jgi:hypothetical protein
MLKTPIIFPTLELATLDGIIGTRFNGVSSLDYSGRSVASAGDMNGDGFGDLIIGANLAAPGARTNAGPSFVVFGTNKSFGAALELSTLNGTNGFRINGVSNSDYSGYSVASAGDMNGDGLSDLIIGAYGADPGGRASAGSSFVVFGTHAGFGATLELSALNGANGFRINGVSAGDQSGRSVASAGDINGDGSSDLIIGADYASPGGRTNAGSSFVVFGTRSGFGAALELSTLNGTNGFRINGVLAGDWSGCSVANAGDINGDGLSDLIIGANGASPGGWPQAGSSFVVFGTRSGFGAALELSTLNGTNGFSVNGVSNSDYSGQSVASAGDINGDGLSDLIIGAHFASPGGRTYAGSSFVVFGTNKSFGAVLELTSLNGTNGFRINGVSAYDSSGNSVASAGDINGDGLSDLIIGAWRATPTGRANAGSSFVIFGTNKSFSATLELSTLNGTNGFRINGVAASDASGISVARAGDINGDGLSDLIIGAHLAGPGNRTDAGSTYLVFGDSPPVLANNSLTMTDCTVTLNSTYLGAYDSNHDNSTLTFTASNVINGKFQKNIGGVITQLTTLTFPQSDITSGYIQFVSTSSNAPSYSMIVSSSGLAFVPATPATISFTAPFCSESPTQAPSFAPTVAPTAPTSNPTTGVPTVAPTATPTAVPTAKPTFAPSLAPTVATTATPTAGPTAPTALPSPSFNSGIPTQAPSATPSSSEISSAARTSPAWFLPISQVVSLLDSTLPAAYQSVSGYLSGSDASSQPDTHNTSYTSPSLETVGAQLMLGAVALKLAQKGVNWAIGFWASKPALKTEIAPALSEATQSLQTKGEPVSRSVTQDLMADMKHLSEKMENYQACLEEAAAQSPNVVYPDFQKPGISFYNTGARKRTPATVEQAIVTNTRLATLGH